MIKPQKGTYRPPTSHMPMDKILTSLFAIHRDNGTAFLAVHYKWNFMPPGRCKLLWCRQDGYVCVMLVHLWAIGEEIHPLLPNIHSLSEIAKVSFGNIMKHLPGRSSDLVRTTLPTWQWYDGMTCYGGLDTVGHNHCKHLKMPIPGGTRSRRLLHKH